MNEKDMKAKECFDFLKNYCNEGNCTKNCPFAYEYYTVQCILGGNKQMYPCEWEDNLNKEKNNW